jgi:competence protein ComFC
MAPRLRWSVALQNFVFPPSCFSCGTLLEDHHELLCPACAGCVRAVTASDPLLLLARTRLAQDGVCAGLVALYHFASGGPVQDLLHGLKYGGLTGIGRTLGTRLGEAIRHEPWAGDIDLIIPLPLFRAKQRERGYNQAESIARGIGRVLRKPVRPRIVRRLRWTDSQTTLGFAARQMNVRGAFGVSRRKSASLAGKTVLLVDDVVTTGATIRACAAVLRDAGAAAVLVAAAALSEHTGT